MAAVERANVLLYACHVPAADAMEHLSPRTAAIGATEFDLGLAQQRIMFLHAGAGRRVALRLSLQVPQDLRAGRIIGDGVAEVL